MIRQLYYFVHLLIFVIKPRETKQDGTSVDNNAFVLVVLPH